MLKCRNVDFFLPVQVNHTRAASGLLALAEAGRHNTVRAVQCLEVQLGREQVKLSFFRGYETMAILNILQIFKTLCLCIEWAMGTK